MDKIYKVKVPINLTRVDNKKYVNILVSWKNCKTNKCYSRTPDNWTKEHCAILTGKINDLTVVDIDSLSAYEWYKKTYGLTGLIGLGCHIIKSYNGFHLYYKYTKDILTSTNVYPKIDIRNDNAIIYNGKSYQTIKKCNEILQCVPKEFVIYCQSTNFQVKRCSKCSGSSENFNSLKKLELPKLPDNFHLNMLNKDLLYHIPNPPKTSKYYLGHNLVWRLMVWSVHQGLTFEEFWQWCKNKDDSNERKNKYQDYYNNCSYKIRTSFVIEILEYLYPELTTTRNNELFYKYTKCDSTKIINSNYLSVNDLTESKYQYLQIRCGGNKTGTIIDYLNKHPMDSVLIITPRIALNYDIKGRYGENLYTHTELKNKSSNYTEYVDLLNNTRKVAMCLQSIYHLTKTFDIVIFDEIETTLNCYDGDCKTVNSHYYSIWNTLKNLCINAEKIFIMDGFFNK